ncbi:Uncharacterized protein TCAP_06964 [Tolypocladium capitatum]|uniref:Uncharacterized protein n=1 Tax=Tolypocladium capitatum TaxID=45235 RepID=A0A2K3Q6C8_9HYPO|nr:Uncharacterized protein TCAP_06964 [Tolypocladium capitatum]
MADSVSPPSASGEAGGRMDVDSEQNGKPEVKQPRDDSDPALPTGQTVLCLPSSGSASNTEQEVDDEDDDASSVFGSDDSSNDDGEWALLHGFQGVVPFLVRDVTTFETAVKSLLALSPHSTETYVLVHFDAREGRLVEIEDQLSTSVDGPATSYIAEHWNLDDHGEDVSEHDDNCCALFVRLKGEETPSMWKPTDGQFKADVAQIKHVRADVNMSQSRGRASTAYISFPKTTGPDGPHISLWDAGEYVAYMQTAVDVLLGCLGDNRLHHCVLQLAKSSDDGKPASFSRSYYAVPVRPQDIQAMHPQQQPEDVLLRRYLLSGPKVMFMLPGFYPEPTSDIVNVIDVVDLQPHTPDQLPKAVAHIRRMVTRFLGDEAVGVSYVRLLHGDATLNPARVNRRHLSTVLPMSDPVVKDGQTLPVEFCTGLARFLDTRPRFVVLHPLYKHGEVHMHAGWPSDAPPEQRLRPLQPLLSSVEHFRASVVELSRSAMGTEGSGGCVLYEPQMHRVSIRAVVSESADVEASTFFVGPRTTTEEWHTIRAQLPTRNVVVNIWPPAKWAWRRQIARSNIWGPRYGRAVDGNARAMQERATGQAVLPAMPSSMLSSMPVKKPTLAAPEASSPGHHDAPPKHHKHHQQPSTSVSECPHTGCSFTFRGDERAVLERHVRERHVARKCLWCEEPLQGWTDEAKDAHLRGKHRDRLMQALGVRRATINQHDGSATLSIALKRIQWSADSSTWATNRYSAPPVGVGRLGTDDDEGWRASANPLPPYGAGQKFCDACGRDRRQFFSEAEQAYHDRHCTPGIYHGARCTFCTKCGDYRWGSDLDAERSRRGHGAATSCGHGTGSAAGQFCQRCGLDYNSLLRGGREVHESCCRGYGAQPGRFCPHCGVRFWEGHAQADWHYNTLHIETCEARDVVVKQPDITNRDASEDDSQPRRASSAPPGRFWRPKQPASKKKQQKPKPKPKPKTKPKHRQHPGADDPLPSVEDGAHRHARKRRRPHPDDSDYEYNSDVDTADGLAPDNSSTDGDPKDAEAARRRKRRRMTELDPAYQYETDEDSADGLQPDVDDLHGGEGEQVDVEAEAEAQAQGLAPDEELARDKAMAKAMAKGQGKGRRPHNAAYRYASDADSADGLKPDVDDLNHMKRRRPHDPHFRRPKGVSPVPAGDAVPPSPSLSPAAKKGGEGRKPAKKSSPKKASPKKASPRKPGQPKETAKNTTPSRRSARIGSKKP